MPAYTSRGVHDRLRSGPRVAGEATPAPAVVRSSAAPRSATRKTQERGGPSRGRHRKERASSPSSAMGDTTDDLVRLAYRSPRPSRRARHADLGRRAISCALAAMAVTTSVRGDLAHRQPGGDRPIPRARQGEDRRRTRRRIHEALDEEVVLVAGFRASPRTWTSPPWGAAAPTRRRRPRRGPQRESLRDLHRRRRRVQRRPPSRSERPQAPCRQLRRDAGAGCLRRQGASATLGRGRAKLRRQAARSLDVQR